MNWSIDEALFYGGMILLGCDLLAGAIYFCIAKIKSVKLKAKLDKEYGEKER